MHTSAPWDCTGCLFPDDDLGGVYYRLQAEGMDARADNARLIASAPDLLEALEDAFTAILQLDEGALGYADGPADGNGEGFIYPIRDELATKISATLRKAKGEA